MTAIKISVDYGFPGDGALKLYVSSDAADGLATELAAAGIESEPILEFANASEIAVLAVQYANVPALALVLRTYLHRHDHKHFSVPDPLTGEKIKADGYSIEDLNKLLSAVRQHQIEVIDAQWREATRIDEPEEESEPE